jgi:hypothetical protein
MPDFLAFIYIHIHGYTYKYMYKVCILNMWKAGMLKKSSVRHRSFSISLQLLVRHWHGQPGTAFHGLVRAIAQLWV